MGKIIAITNQKGGVGKSTTAISLASYIANEGIRVLLIDMDPQGNATSGAGIRPVELSTSVYEVLLGMSLPHHSIIGSISEKMDVLPSNVNLSGAEIELLTFKDNQLRLKKALQPLVSFYDFIIIDCPPALGLLTLNALAAADSIIIPIQCEYYALEGLSQLIHTIHLIRKRLNPALELEGIVMTMFDARTKLSATVVDEVRRFFKDKVYNSIIPRNIKLCEAPSHGKSIRIYDPECKGAIQYKNLAKEVIENVERSGKRIRRFTELTAVSADQGRGGATALQVDRARPIEGRECQGNSKMVANM